MSLKNTHQILIIFTIHGAGHLYYINKYNATEHVISLLIVCFFREYKGVYYTYRIIKRGYGRMFLSVSLFFSLYMTDKNIEHWFKFTSEISLCYIIGLLNSGKTSSFPVSQEHIANWVLPWSLKYIVLPSKSVKTL